MTTSSVTATASPVPSASTSQRWVIALTLCTLACALSIRFVDRLVADFVQMHLRHTSFYTITSRMLGLLLVGLPLSFVTLLASGMMALAGRALPSWLRTAVLCSWSIVWSLSSAIMFKEGIGRTSPDPTYVIDHIYGFQFLAGAPGREAFPSATTAVSAAVLSFFYYGCEPREAACSAPSRSRSSLSP